MPDWVSEANCCGLAPYLFFETEDDGIAAAKTVCRGCVVRDACLDHATAHAVGAGIWGGLSEVERPATPAAGGDPAPSTTHPSWASVASGSAYAHA